MSTPFFSIVIPTYNRAQLILNTLASVEEQRFRDFEIIVVDDGSTDNTEEVLNRITDHKFRFFKRPNNERGAARNFGILQASGSYVTFCDSDDILYPDYLSNAYETINTNNSPVWLHVAYEIKGDKGKSVKIHNLKNNFTKKLAKGNPLSCMGVFVKREYLALNLFHENRYLAGSEDWELWLRLSAKYPIVFDNRISAALIVHDDRSVVHTTELKLQLRKYLSIGYAFDDEDVQKKYGRYRKLMAAYFDTYIALHLVLGGKKGVFRYLFKAIAQHPSVLIDRRALAILKHIGMRLLSGKN